ncbi:AMMECR1 domain-containing protein [bacterium]|nr:AMMECR1 domain-containing protein [bacterium]MBT4633456.1 AMMECR1 domain-containing protein [bacterium]MBT5491538.1 AMMECR1 domain-containing protein [bacterium]MBT6779343.1 AMMECR1 domain-containing protein [bacterium]
MKEIKANLVEELIENTITAISKDTRFEAVKNDEIKDLKIRIDLIENRNVLQDKAIMQIDPTKS